MNSCCTARPAFSGETPGRPLASKAVSLHRPFCSAAKRPSRDRWSADARRARAALGGVCSSSCGSGASSVRGGRGALSSSRVELPDGGRYHHPLVCPAAPLARALEGGAAQVPLVARTSAMMVMVLPKPGSSASMPPRQSGSRSGGAVITSPVSRWPHTVVCGPPPPSQRRGRQRGWGTSAGGPSRFLIHASASLWCGCSCRCRPGDRVAHHWRSARQVEATARKLLGSRQHSTASRAAGGRSPRFGCPACCFGTHRAEASQRGGRKSASRSASSSCEAGTWLTPAASQPRAQPRTRHEGMSVAGGAAGVPPEKECQSVRR